MSQVLADSLLGGLTAGNTVDSLSSVDRDKYASLPSANDLDVIADEEAAREATSGLSIVAFEVPKPADAGDPLDNENTFDVSRAEFAAIEKVVLKIVAAITKHNVGASHKIILES